jgi:hypothetical protein
VFVAHPLVMGSPGRFQMLLQRLDGFSLIAQTRFKKKTVMRK